MIALSNKVQRVMMAEKISMEELVHMIVHAAPATNERGNRRFHHWLFSVVNGNVVNMQHWDIPTQHHKGTAEMETYDECEDCEGEGCKTCGWTGEVHMKYTPR